ncbi:MAG TPA: DUF3300 domain-containing protein [Verrucomicrobiae bacterium]|nr:DUF3300 domain-containing protein [Verrucomicrobiae bacterium]
MKRNHWGLVLGVIAILSMMVGGNAAAQQPPDNVQGDWTIYSTNVDTGEVVVKHVQIAQYGDRITGYFEGPFQSGPIQGEVNAHHIRFSTVTKNVLNFRGEIYGDNITGSYGIHGKHGAWQAQRIQPVAQVVPTPPTAEYSAQPELAPAQAPAPAAAPTQQYTQQAVPQAPAPVAQTSYPSYPPSATTSAQSDPAPTAAPMTSEQLDALVAPIALYPDSLVAQIMAAATFPEQITFASAWLNQNPNLTGANLAQAVDQQSWDASVKALTQFPSVLNDLAKNLSWTSSLGQAFSNQQSDVMAAVQVMRAKAQAAGNLQSSSQLTVTQPSPNVIVIQPANPQVVYVPQYNPTIVYGAPIVVPMYTPPVAFVATGVSFGSGISIGAFWGGGGGFVGGGFGWGFHAWACNWGGGGGGNTIIYNHNTYITNNTWRTNNYNGYHPWGPGPRPYGPNGGRGYTPTGYHPGTDTHYGPNGGYHPNGYFGPNGAFHHDVPGTNPANQPNGGQNGNHGLIGGNNGVRDKNAGMNGPGVAPAGGYHDRNQNRVLGDGPNRSHMSGNGGATRMESQRGRDSMAGRRSQPHPLHEHAPAEHHSSGGGGHRR